ncbi:uncharacterized protein LOC143284904 isoform X2 [Babylonia areolata]
MAPLRPLPEDITSLTDQELVDQLLQYNYTPGPILPSTRTVYERKLFKLKTGQEAVPSSRYEQVHDDDDDDDQADDDSADEEVILQQHLPRQRLTKTTYTPEVRKTPPRQQEMSRKVERPSSANRSQSAQSARLQKEKSPPSTGGLPLWVKLLAIVIVAVLVFLVVKNLESDPASEGPDIPEELHFNV